MSRSRYYSFIALSMMAFCVSCEKETQNVVIPERSEVADPSYYEPGTMLVDFDERVVESLEKQVPTKAGFSRRQVYRASTRPFLPSQYIRLSEYSRMPGSGRKDTAKPDFISFTM